MIGFFSLFHREIARFFKVIVQTIITPAVSSALYLLVFGVSLGSTVQSQNGVDYLAFLIPGLMMMGLLNNAFQNSSSSIVNSKYTGELEDLRVVPLSHHQIIGAMSLAAMVRGLVVAFVTFIVGTIFYAIMHGGFIGLHSPFEFLFFTVVGGLVFGMLGLAAAFYAKSFDQLSAVSAFILLPLTYLGGVFISIKNLSPFWQQVSALNPLLYFINGLRHAILGVSDIPVGQSMLVSLFGLGLFYVLALLALKRGNFHRW
ncbi:MAG: ABC transporter permease [Bdellovibrio sp.]|jgi:ABC-2 type transport system permease protein